jgi:hypothetical protein
MSFLRIDDGFAEHPKIVALSDLAFRVHVAALCYSARNLTDGHLPPNYAAADRAVVRELVRAGVWETEGKGFRIHDWHQWNPTAEEVRLRRKASRDRIREWRRRRDAGEV